EADDHRVVVREAWKTIARPAFTAREDQSVEDLLMTLKDRRQHLALVETKPKISESSSPVPSETTSQSPEGESLVQACPGGKSGRAYTQNFSFFLQAVPFVW